MTPQHKPIYCEAFPCSFERHPEHYVAVPTLRTETDFGTRVVEPFPAVGETFSVEPAGAAQIASTMIPADDPRPIRFETVQPPAMCLECWNAHGLDPACNLKCRCHVEVLTEMEIAAADVAVALADFANEQLEKPGDNTKLANLVVRVLDCLPADLQSELAIRAPAVNVMLRTLANGVGLPVFPAYELFHDVETDARGLSLDRNPSQAGTPIILEEFILENTFEDEEESGLRLLDPGQCYIGGGGGAPTWMIRRIQ